MEKDTLNPVACEVVGTLFAVIDPKAESDYRQSLEVIDTNPTFSALLQVRAMVRAGHALANAS